MEENIIIKEIIHTICDDNFDAIGIWDNVNPIFQLFN